MLVYICVIYFNYFSRNLKEKKIIIKKNNVFLLPLHYYSDLVCNSLTSLVSNKGFIALPCLLNSLWISMKSIVPSLIPYLHIQNGGSKIIWILTYSWTGNFLLAWAGQIAGIENQTTHRFEQYLKILQLCHEKYIRVSKNKERKYS
jgi:hypothetical protein